jgi:large conductance mechanosensitive channel
MSFLSEFKAFAMRGSVVDLAVGVVVGAGFNKIVSSFVADIFMPPLGLLIGGVDLNRFAWTLKLSPNPAEAVVIRYGAFLQTVFDFVLIAFAIFLVVRIVHRVRAHHEANAPTPPPTSETQLLTEIRDLLRQQIELRSPRA